MGKSTQPQQLEDQEVVPTDAVVDSAFAELERMLRDRGLGPEVFAELRQVAGNLKGRVSALVKL